MSKHLTGSKRLAVIHRWLNGMDDPDWEVLPTKKKDKYIVKLRTTPISLDYRENSESENYAMVKYAGSLSPSSRKKACYIGFGVCSARPK